jgi:glyoxylase-like metal-dependent hydrolase (beta-lactamase superfamily II)
LFIQKYKSETNEIQGVYQIKIDVPFPVHYVCVYIFKIDDSFVIFDSGLDMGNWYKVFLSALESLNLSLKDIDYCFISHEHTDHTGLMGKFKRENPNMQIMMSAVANETLKWETDPENYDQLEEAAKEIAREVIKYGIDEKQGKRLVEWFTMWPKLRKYHKPDRLLYDNDEISFASTKLKVIWTPGHAIGHICLFEQKNQFLFSGDHILSRITPHIGNFLVNPEISLKYDFDDILKHYLNSLDRIDQLNPKIIFPAHQEIIHNPHERILEIKQHHENRLHEISTLIKNNPLTPYKISQIHFGTDLDEMNSFLALSEVMGHLIYLEKKNEVKRIEKNNKIFFVS